MTMTMRKLASLIAKREGKKHQASIGDIREILKIFFDIYASEDMADLMNEEEEKRNRKKK